MYASLAEYKVWQTLVGKSLMMKRIKYIAMACFLFASLGVGAKSMKDLLVSMPDSLLPYLDKNLRQEMPELQEMGVKAEVKNLLGENSVLDTLTDNFLQVRMSKVATLQLKKLPVEQGDSILCMVKTFAGPEKESQLMLFDQDWNALDASKLFCYAPSGGAEVYSSLDSLADNLVSRPDTMTEERFVELKKMIEPKMVSVLLFEHENAAVVRLSLPLLSADDKKKVNAIKLQRKFNWKDRTFKES